MCTYIYTHTLPSPTLHRPSLPITNTQCHSHKFPGIRAVQLWEHSKHTGATIVHILQRWLYLTGRHSFGNPMVTISFHQGLCLHCGRFQPGVRVPQTGLTGRAPHFVSVGWLCRHFFTPLFHPSLALLWALQILCYKQKTLLSFPWLQTLPGAGQMQATNNNVN